MILLTGATGVLGVETAARLPADRVILARHRARPAASARQARIDISEPGLGLAAADYDGLAATVSVVVHAAAITEMSGDDAALDATNVAGARHVAEFARDAGAILHFVSTAYCDPARCAPGAEASPYIRSKRAAEAAVLETAPRATIIRPSILIGHSETGRIASEQGFHLFVAAILKSRLPFIPLSRGAYCDFIPADVAAAALARIVAAPEIGRTYWLTAGADAVTVEDLMDFGRPFAERLGRDLDAVPLMEPAEARAMLDADPRIRGRLRAKLDLLLQLAEVMATPEPFPSDSNALRNGEPPVDKRTLQTAFNANMEAWLAGGGHGKSRQASP